MSSHHFYCSQILMLLVLAGSLTGCKNTLIFTERTKAAISVEFNPTDSSEPVQLTAGYKRSVVGVVPPKKPSENNDATHKGEALALISNFRLGYENNEQMNTLYVRNGFASGTAAKWIAMNPAAVDALLGRPSLRPVSPELKIRRRAAGVFVDTLDQAQLNTIASKIGAAPGPSARKGIKRRILRAQSDAEFKIVCSKIKETQIQGSEDLACQ